MEFTLALIKPDAVRQGKAQEIKHIIEQNGFTIFREQRMQLTEGQAAEFYAEHSEQDFYPPLVEFMTSGPIEALVLCKENAIKTWRTLMGPTNVFRARADSPQCLRALFGTDGMQNATHGSDSPASAEREIRYFFKDISLELSNDEPPCVEWTFAMIKPDAVKKGKAQEIKQLIELSGFTIIMQQKVQLTRMRAEEFYAEHYGKPFFNTLVDFMTSGPVWALVLCRKNAIKAWRSLMGPTNSNTARENSPRCLRALYGTDGTQNATHGSDARQSACREIKFFFPNLVLEPLLEPVAAKAFITSQLQPALAKALTALARDKPSAEKFEAITFLANFLLANNPNKPRIITPEEWDPSMEEEDDEADFAHAKLRAAEFSGAEQQAAVASTAKATPVVQGPAAVPSQEPAAPVHAAPPATPPKPATPPPPTPPNPSTPPAANAAEYTQSRSTTPQQQAAPATHGSFGLSAELDSGPRGSLVDRAEVPEAAAPPAALEDEEAEPNDMSAMNEAATKVQAAFKGHQARKQVQQMRVDEQLSGSMQEPFERSSATNEEAFEADEGAPPADQDDEPAPGQRFPEDAPAAEQENAEAEGSFPEGGDEGSPGGDEVDFAEGDEGGEEED